MKKKNPSNKILNILQTTSLLLLEFLRVCDKEILFKNREVGLALLKGGKDYHSLSTSFNNQFLFYLREIISGREKKWRSLWTGSNIIIIKDKLAISCIKQAVTIGDKLTLKLKFRQMVTVIRLSFYQGKNFYRFHF